MHKDFFTPRPAARITCVAHRLLGGMVADRLMALGAEATLVENARGVRQRVRSRAWKLPGQTTDMDDSPMEVFRTTVSREAARWVAGELIDAGKLRALGHGMIYIQEATEYSRSGPPEIDFKSTELPSGMLHEMSLLTCILSQVGGGDMFSRVALSLGAGVPVIARGTGTGIRDRLGLLRIAIPHEKEIVRLIVPAHDAESIRCLLIEEARLDRPGGGFLYQTPIKEGLIDSLMRIGKQRHAASMDQVIAALDDLKKGTTWRKRFRSVSERSEHAVRKTSRPYREIAFSCPEGQANELVRAGMEAGASGATTAQARSIAPDAIESGEAARETGILCVPAATGDNVLKLLLKVVAKMDDANSFVQTLDAPAVFAHQRD